MDKIPEDIILYICEYSLNESVFALSKVSSRYANYLFKPFFIEYIRYRDHPIMFNLIDNYCKYCNLKCQIVMLKNIQSCSHI